MNVQVLVRFRTDDLPEGGNEEAINKVVRYVVASNVVGHVAGTFDWVRGPVVGWDSNDQEWAGVHFLPMKQIGVRRDRSLGRSWGYGKARIGWESAVGTR